jgi:hypothetical protein
MVPIPSEETFWDFSGKQRSLCEDSKFQDIKEIVVEVYIKAGSTQLPHARAGDFVNELYQNKMKLTGKEFLELLEKFEIKKEKIACYSKNKLPNVNGVASTYPFKACDLDEDRHSTDPRPTTFGSVVLFLEQDKGAQELSLVEAKSVIRKDIQKERMLKKFSEKIKKIHLELVDGIFSDKNLHKIFDEHDLEFDSYKGISIGNAAEKGVDQLYVNAVMSLEKSEQIKLMPLGDAKVLMFVVVKRKFPTNDFFERKAN